MVISGARKPKSWDQTIGNINAPSVLISTQRVQKYAYWNGGSVSNEIFYAFKHRISTA